MKPRYRLSIPNFIYYKTPLFSMVFRVRGYIPEEMVLVLADHILARSNAFSDTKLSLSTIRAMYQPAFIWKIPLPYSLSLIFYIMLGCHSSLINSGNTFY